MQNIINCLNSFNELPNIESDRYEYQGKHVPRVTEILSAMIHEDYLMQWANYLGLVKRIRYQEETEKACFIGTNVHNYIEDYIRNDIYNKENIKDIRDLNIRNSIDNAVESFILWYNDVRTNHIDIVGIEQKMSCKWFGGTYDVLVKINDKLYIVDFKTSNHVGYKYFLQMAAYKYMLETEYNIFIDGVIILQLDKKEISYEEYFLDLSNSQHSEFMQHCTNTFLSLVFSYYNILQAQHLYNNIF